MQTAPVPSLPSARPDPFPGFGTTPQASPGKTESRP